MAPSAPAEGDDISGVSEIDRVSNTTTRSTGARGFVDHGSAEALVALLDLSGTIVAVNAAWESAAVSRGGDPARTGVGESYLRVADDPADPQSAEITLAILAALDGDLVTPRRLRQQCGPVETGGQDLFDVFVGSRYDESLSCVGASVVWAPARPADVPERLRPLLPAQLAERLLVADPADHVLVVLRTLVEVVEEALPTPSSMVGASVVHVAVGPQAELVGRWAASADHRGPTLRLPLEVDDRVLGVLLVSRVDGDPPFTAQEIETLTGCVRTSARALQIVETRARSAAAEREQLLAQLYERVAEETFDATVLLSAQLALVSDDNVRGQLLSVVDHLDRGVRRLRAWIFGSSDDSAADRS